MMKPATGVGLVGRLVLREADVAVDAKHRSLRIATNLRREAREPYVELLDEVAHRRAHLLLVVCAVRVKPLFVVVSRELLEEAKCRGGKGHGASMSMLCPA